MSFVTLDKSAKAGKAPKEPKAAPALRSGRSSRLLPTVNLLSPTHLDGIAVSRVRNRFVVGGLVLALGVGAGWMVQTAELHSAQDRLAAEQAMKPALQQQVDALAPVATFYEGVAARKATASSAMAAEVLFSGALKDLAKRTPAGMDVKSMAVALNGADVTSIAPPKDPLAEAGLDANGNVITPKTTPPASGAAAPAASSADDPSAALDKPAVKKPVVAVPTIACARPDPFNPSPIIGCVTLTGTAASRAVVGEFITALKASKLYADPFITVTTISGEAGEESVQFNGSVGLTGASVSGRYVNLDWLSDPKVLRKAQQMIRDGQTASVRWAAQAKHDAAVEKARKAAEAKALEAEQAAKQAAAEAEAAKQIQEAAQAAAEAAALANGTNGGNS